jgi:fatty acyl-CoA reductase
VVNATMVAMAAHYGEETQVIYHVTSSHQNPLRWYHIEELAYGYLFFNPRVRDGTRTIQHKRLLFFNRYVYFHAYMVLAYKIPLQVCV